MRNAQMRSIVTALILSLALPGIAFAGSTTSDKGYGVDPCYKQCSPTLQNVKPRSEATRVFKNCMAYCQHKGTIDCGNGVFVKPTRFCPGNRLKGL
jgi:hypothetical protein